MTIFSLPNANIVFSGQWTNIIAGGHDAAQMLGQNSRLDTIVCGTSLSLFGMIGSGALMEASVDGGAFIPLTPVFDVWAALPIFSGLADAAHPVTVRHAGGNRDWYLDRAQALEVLGASPELQLPVGFGTAATLDSASIRAEGGWSPAAVAGYAASSCREALFPDAAIRFRSNAASLRAWMFQGGLRYHLMSDGVDLCTVNDSGSLKWDWLTLAEGLDGGEHEYALTVAYCGTGAVYAYALMPIIGVLLPAAFPARRKVAFLGDSITRGDTLNGDAPGWVHTASMRLRLEAFNFGRNGSRVKSQSQDDMSGETPERVAEVVSSAPHECVILYGVVDMLDGTSAINFEAAYQSMVTQIRAALPGTRLHCLGILANTQNSSAARAEYSAAIRSAIAGVENAFFHDTEQWLSIATDLADGLHPNAVGHAKIAARVEGILHCQTISSSNHCGGRKRNSRVICGL